MNEKFRSAISHSSDDKVKALYSWHGPYGAISNSKMLDVDMLAHASQGFKYIEDQVPLEIFNSMPHHYEYYPCQGLEDDDKRPFVYSLPLYAENRPTYLYFRRYLGILEEANMPIGLIDLVRTGNGYILLDFSDEADMGTTTLRAMHNYFHEIHKLPMYKIIYLVGSPNAQQIYDDWATRYNILNDREHRMTLLSLSGSLDAYTHQWKESNQHRINHPGEDFADPEHHLHNQYYEPEYDENYLPEKLFLTWNRRYRLQRTLLALILEELNLIDKTTISFPRESDEWPDQTFALHVHDLVDKDSPDLYMGIELAPDIIERFTQRLPLIIDGSIGENRDAHDFCTLPVGPIRHVYEDTLVSLVTETNYMENEISQTEKSFKPLYARHPFILLGAPGSLQCLRDMGFKTFSDFWDESYDSIEDPKDRLMLIKDQIKKIASWDDQQILEFKRKVKPIIDHNYDMFKVSHMAIIGQAIYDHITDNFNPDDTLWCTLDGACQE